MVMSKDVSPRPLNRQKFSLFTRYLTYGNRSIDASMPRNCLIWPISHHGNREFRYTPGS
jgi:hypothetical protein